MLTDYQERKSKAYASGSRVEYVTCPLCGRNRPLIMWNKETRFEVKPDYAIIQVRYGGGRGSGFFLSESESVKLDRLKQEYPELFENLKSEIEKLHKIFSVRSV